MSQTPYVREGAIELTQLNDEDGALTDKGAEVVLAAFHALGVDSMTNAEQKGWYDDASANRSFGEETALFTSEISEALEEWRNNRGFGEIYFHRADGSETKDASEGDLGSADDLVGALNKPEGIAAELGDAVIRFADSAGKRGIPLGLAIVLKLRFNRTRPYRHGGKKA